MFILCLLFVVILTIAETLAQFTYDHMLDKRPEKPEPLPFQKLLLPSFCTVLILAISTLAPGSVSTGRYILVTILLIGFGVGYEFYLSKQDENRQQTIGTVFADMVHATKRNSSVAGIRNMYAGVIFLPIFAAVLFLGS